MMLLENLREDCRELLKAMEVNPSQITQFLGSENIKPLSTKFSFKSLANMHVLGGDIKLLFYYANAIDDIRSSGKSNVYLSIFYGVSEEYVKYVRS